MSRARETLYGQQRVSLRQTLVLALFLHLMLAGAAQWQPELLWSVPVVPPLEAPRPLEFRFVDTPDAALPEQTPETEVLSDRDRVAQDASPRDDADDPFSEGNTSQEVLRSEPAAPTANDVVQPIPSAAAVAQPLEASRSEPELVGESGAESGATEAARREEEPTETIRPLPELPPAQPRLLTSMARLNSFVEPEIYRNLDGGSDGQEGLVSFDTKGYELGPYIRDVLRIIERNWKSNIPAAARLPGMAGATFVSLSIERVRADGVDEVAQIVIHRTWPSGTRSFDQAAVFALEISSPLPPIPEFFPYDSLDGRIGFLYNLRADQVTFPPGK